MKKLFLILLFIPLMSLPVCAAAGSGSSASSQTDVSGILQQQAQQSGTDNLYGKVPQDTKKALNKFNIRNPDIDDLSSLTPSNLFSFVLNSIGSSVTAPLKSVAIVIGILIAYALLNTLKNSFNESSLKSVFDIVCSLCIAAALLVPISGCISYCAGIIKQSADFMNTFLPVFVGLVAASGHPASAVTFQGIILVVSDVVSEIASTTFIPMLSIYLAFCVIGSITPSVNINGIANFFKSLVNWALGICLTIFVGLLTVQGLISQAADTVTMKTAKFVVGSVVPVIGSTISDAMNTVVGCANLLKTATGAYAIIVFLLTFLPPLLTCVLWLLAVQLSIAGAEILGVGNVSGLLKAINEALKILVALVLTIALAMIVSTSVMLLLGMENS